ncbi:MAG: IS630 family transposase [Bdellovibrionaceae bacterium]|nr:IS630 family transposase [Pseudobdellovibrionaceae bacterium]
MISGDEARFRQDSTLHRTWSRKDSQPLVPVTGQRKSVKVFGCVDIVSAKFIYNMDEVFNVPSYLNFLEYAVTKMFQKNKRVFYIQDNASYHKSDEIWKWFKENRKGVEVFNLPPYYKKLNAAESLWKYTRREGAQNVCLENEEQIHTTLHAVFDKVQESSTEISGYLRPFF